MSGPSPEFPSAPRALHDALEPDIPLKPEDTWQSTSESPVSQYYDAVHPESVDTLENSLHPDTEALLQGFSSTDTARRLTSYVRVRLHKGGIIGDTEDVVQEVLLAFMKQHQHSPPTLHDADGLLRYLYGIASHKVTDAYRTIIKSSTREQLTDQIPEIPLEGFENTVIWHILEDSYFETTKKDLGLKRQQLVIFDLLLKDPTQSVEDLSSQLGITVGAARTAKHRLLKTLRNNAEYFAARGIFITAMQQSSEKQSPKPKKVLPPTRLGSNMLRALRIHQAAGGQEAALHIPAYIGQWHVAVKTACNFKLREDSTVSAAIVYPHPHLLPEFRRYIGHIIGRQSGVKKMAITITSGEEVAQSLSENTFDYTIISDNISPELRKRIRSSGSFLLDLLTAADGPVEATHTMPSYEEAGGKSLPWTANDTLRYLTEWQFATGEQLTSEQATKLSQAGQGPPLQRLCRGIGSFAAVQAWAGYSFKVSPDPDATTGEA